MSFQLSLPTRIFICMEPLSFRGGFNVTAAACRLRLRQNPLAGGLFVFINKNRTMIRFYFFDGHGEVLISKRVATGKFKWWKDQATLPEEIMVEHLYLLLRGGDPQSVHFPSQWKRIENTPATYPEVEYPGDGYKS